MSVRPLVLLVLLAAQAGCSDGKKICTRAADQYTACVEKVLGKEMADLARSKREAGIEACADDDRTIKMYRKCLPEKDCTRFLKCLEDEAAGR